MIIFDADAPSPYTPIHSMNMSVYLTLLFDTFHSLFIFIEICFFETLSFLLDGMNLKAS